MVKVALKLEQRTKLSQIQRLTIKMLTLRSQELTDFLHEQVAENPLLDIRYGDVKSQADAGKEKPLDAVRSRADSLEESLMKQLRLQTLPRPVLLAAGLVIRSLDEKGFCTGNLAELGQEYALDGATMDKGLAVVQSLDPPGIGARDIRECLLLQTRRHGQAPAGTEHLLSQYYEDFLQGKWQKLQHEMDLSEKDFKAIRDFLKTLALQPASTADAETEFIRPDVEIYEAEPGKLAVRSLEELPDVFFRDDLYKEYEAQGDKKTRTYIHRARRAFLSLQSALAYRWQSIFLVLQCVAQYQSQHFLQGLPLRPLRQKDAAYMTGLSTATVSRVCHGRYVLFSGHVYRLQDFFAQAYACQNEYEDGEISDQAIKEKIRDHIAAEAPDYPWSDQELADWLAAQQIHIARRTVAKFRLQLQIPNSTIRRRLKE